MSGILFLLEIIAFVAVVRWAFLRSGPNPANAETGWFGMRTGDGGDVRTPKAGGPPSAPQGRQAGLNRAEPRWKRSRPRWPPPA
jgi:hypothetical protein